MPLRGLRSTYGRSLLINFFFRMKTIRRNILLVYVALVLSHICRYTSAWYTLKELFLQKNSPLKISPTIFFQCILWVIQILTPDLFRRGQTIFWYSDVPDRMVCHYYVTTVISLRILFKSFYRLAFSFWYSAYAASLLSIAKFSL